MNDIEDLHRAAMNLADRADASGRDVIILRQAFDLERAAALLAAERGVPQPSLGVLYSSAASLAIECGLYPEAKALVDQALSSSDELPGDLAADLIELRDDINARTATRSAP